MDEFKETKNFQLKIIESMELNTDVKKRILENIEIADQINKRAWHSFGTFFGIVLGSAKEDYPNMTTMFFPQRFLNVVESKELGIEKYAIVFDIIYKCFYLGFIYHCANYNFPTRTKIEIVDFDNLINSKLIYTLVAKLHMGEYSKENNGFADKYFTMFYNEQNFKTILKKNFRVGFFKLGQAESFLNNIFYCGAMYGMYYDMATEEVV